MKRTLFAIACTLTITAPVLRPATAQQITACVRKTGTMYLIGPSYRRQQCRSADTPLTFNTTGPIGPEGPQGPIGNTGQQGPSLKVVDANNQLVGYPIGHGSGGENDSQIFYIYDPTVTAFYSLDLLNSTIRPIEEYTMVYLTTDCSGQLYALGVTNPWVLIGANTPEFHLYLPDRTQGPIADTTTFSSRIQFNGCQQRQSGPDTAYPLVPITLPYAAPFSLVTQ